MIIVKFKLPVSIIYEVQAPDLLQDSRHNDLKLLFYMETRFWDKPGQDPGRHEKTRAAGGPVAPHAALVFYRRHLFQALLRDQFP
jgi:hypothetical protein